MATSSGAAATSAVSPLVGSKGTSVVRLNIGGTKFVTTEATLLSCGSSFFSSLLSGAIPSLKDEDGAYFIDRDGPSFSPILSYLRTGYLILPPHVPKEAVLHEADFYSIDIPIVGHEHINSLSCGLFISDKYKENEVVLFSDNGTGFVIRGGSSKVEFSYELREGNAMEITWQTESSKAQTKQGKDRDRFDDGSSGPRRNTWFLQGTSLITSAINIYSFYKQEPNLRPGAIFVNVRSPLTIADSTIFGFRFPTKEELNSIPQFDRRDTTQDIEPGSPPQQSNSSNSFSNSGNFLYCDVRNQWVKCRFIRSKFCNLLDSYHIRYKSTEPIRHKSYLSYASHEYEMCYETFTVELLLFQNVLLARLVSYNLVRKDRSIIPVQFTTAFVAYQLGLQLEKPPELI